jgi:hypothetical protein
VERKRLAAVKLAVERGLHAGDSAMVPVSETKQEPLVVDDISPLPQSEEEAGEANAAAAEAADPTVDTSAPTSSRSIETTKSLEPSKPDFVPARLPFFS